jgi:hypothetical protein
MTTAPTLTVPLYRLAHGRTGDKGNRSNISVIAWHPALWDTLCAQVTEAAVAARCSLIVDPRGFSAICCLSFIR